MRTRFSSSSDSASSPDAKPETGKHVAVLLHESIEALDIQLGDTVVDATLGGAGHAHALACKLDATGTLIGFDLDHDAIDRARSSLSGVACRLELIEANFRTVGSALAAREIVTIDKALFDLGWSSFQLSVGRGFSFQKDEPLQMTFQSEVGEDTFTAKDLVNNLDAKQLAQIFKAYGDEEKADWIAEKIVEAREIKPIETT